LGPQILKPPRLVRGAAWNCFKTTGNCKTFFPKKRLCKKLLPHYPPWIPLPPEAPFLVKPAGPSPVAIFQVDVAATWEPWHPKLA